METGDRGIPVTVVRGRLWLLVVGAILLVLAFGIVLILGESRDPEILLQQARQAYERGDFQESLRLSIRVLDKRPDDAQAALLSGRSALKLRRYHDAVQHFDSVSTRNRESYVSAQNAAGELLLVDLRRLSEAELRFRQAFAASPNDPFSNERLAFIFGLTSRYLEQIPHRLRLIRIERFSGIHLLSLALGENAIENPESNWQYYQSDPKDPAPLITLARVAQEDQRYEQARVLLENAVRLKPELLEAQSRLGKLLFERGNESDFVEWSRNLPETANDHPGVWVLRGNWALRHSHQQAALRCYCEAIQRDPNHSHALYQAGRILALMKQTDQAGPFLQRAKSLREFLNAVKAADSDDALAAMRKAATLAESLGNYWEAFGWASLAASHPQNPGWAKATTSRLKGELPKLPLQRTVPKHNPVRRFEYRSLPLPEISKTAAAPVAVTPYRKSTGRFSFKDSAASAEIHFRYFNGSKDVAIGTKYMYEVMGGGVAVLDFNGDQLPDVYVSQGCNWPVDESKLDYLDRLYLNTGDGRFVDVTESCGIRENRFSQGVAAGDVDSDGFPDLLVANIGRNRLYHNNGDGTFTDISDEVGFNRADWTTSCSIADLSGDGHPELYLVNYLKGSEVFTRTCGPQTDGVCLPQHFPAADDRLYWNSGNGGFRDVTKISGINAANGKGLGIVVGSFGRVESRESSVESQTQALDSRYSTLDTGLKLNVFVANDTVANFYFENQGPSKNGVPRFRENALLTGLAMNAEGRTEACMGVAAGDADGDGAIDLFITNFLGETNTFYRQLPDGSFDDETLRRGLHHPSLSKLGFGTQFLDADLDGQLDLLVVNGHINNFSRDGRTEYQMHPQFFENTVNAGFREVDSTSLGPYFTQKVLGRSLARLDWNQDGKEDVVISHLDAPLALLENTTQTTGGFLALFLRGVQSNRDAIGTIVRVETKNRSLTRQLTAGDGFQASNERILIFGLGEDRIVRKMTVMWPSGRRDTFKSIPANSRWILIEGAGRLLSAPAD